MGFLTSLTGGDAGKSSKKAINENMSALDTLRTRGYDIIDSGQNNANSALDRGISFYSPYQQTGEAANSMYSNALGLNGADGNAAATGAFQAGPGYDFALKQGEQSALRGASAAGMLNSGNTLTALTQFGQGTANKEYGSWLDRLQGQSAQGLSAAGGAAGLTSGLASLFENAADQRLGLESSVTAGVNDLNSQRAQISDQQRANQTGFLGSLLGGVGKLGLKAATGGLF
jgi:hypothetical protein